ncbi:MAG: hypothetical protein IJF03_11140 [Lachnospiraceae bacterium]|nr:hypothetical protein [Lachnospiraceae bacterium]
MEYKKTGEVKKNVFGSNVTPVQGGRSFMEEQPSMMPGACPWMMPGNNPSMENQPWMMPGNRPMMEGQPMMPGNWSPMMPMMPRNQRQPMMPPYPVYPSNMVMPYYYGETMQGMEFTEEDLDKELEQVMEMYPSTAKEIQKKVVEVCDSIDYEGSILYDEYPDKFVLSRYCDKIFEDMEPSQVEMSSESMESQDVSGSRRQPCRNCRPHDGRRDLIDVLFFNEMFRRRCRKGRCRRW